MFDSFNLYSGDVGLAVVALLIVAAIIAGYIDTLVGGGGLITIPALLVAGIPPIQALGTNKLQASAGTGTASLVLILSKKVSINCVKWAMLTAFVGALAGAVAVQTVDSETLEFVIPVVIMLIVTYFVLSPRQEVTVREPKMTAKTHRFTVVPAVGFYDGMFGPATGSFFVLAGVSLRGQDIVQASVVAKTLNLATNVASLLVFIWYGQVAFLIGFSMMAGQFIGASLGARALMNIDPAKLRKLVVVMCLIMLAVWFINKS